MIDSRFPVAFALCVLLCACAGNDEAQDTPNDSTPPAQMADGSVAADSGSVPGPAVLPADAGGPPGAPAPGTAAPAQGTAAPAGASASDATAQDNGARVLDRASKKYASIRSMQADLVMRVTNPLVRSTTESSGVLYQQRPDRIALRLSKPAEEVILSDGTYLWWYIASSGQAIRTRAAPGSQAVDLQAQFLGDPVTRFNYTMQGSEKVGTAEADVLTLVPKERAGYRSLKVWVDRKDALVRRFEIVETSGVIRRFDLSNVRLNTAIPAATFAFTPPAGVRVLEQ